jgi:hypothetical protein
VWAPLTATATRHLPPHLAGASSAAFNSIRQLGAVLGSAAIAAFMTSRIGAEMPAQPLIEPDDDSGVVLQLPEFLRAPFSAAMSQSVLLPAFIALFGILAALVLVGYPTSGAGRKGKGRNLFIAAEGDVGDDDYDSYVELILHREPDAEPAPADESHREPLDLWHRKLDEPVALDEPIGFAHNGSHVGSRVDDEEPFSWLAGLSKPALRSDPLDDWLAPPPPRARNHNGSARRHLADDEAPRGQHFRRDPDDNPTGYGRHSSGR